ncbi:glycosyltransferase family 2 protein [Limimaricola pyoseonensis]|uniref:Glycosyltransferase, GT2 family n=1 Tax=Limimaricola pyoseonensis TaxID=521013 RepID=A0A1G7IXI5_9RHOB|nr:glycosyltransferase [Limimaricola pyoseonensis]SDF16989.1 Glycosyltransferase, GT2 family [Limimaricola pyoseonensis]
MPRPPELSVIIPHHEDPERLRRCLMALAPQLDAVGDRVEALVVDNASRHSVRPQPMPHPRIRLLHEARRGAAHARNRAVAESRAPWLAFLDCDCVPAEDWLAQALRLARGPALVGGAVRLFDETPAPRSGAEAFEAVFAFDNEGYIARQGFSVTANLLAPRAAFDRAGGFRAGLSEDLDWCRRAVAAGFGLRFEPRLAVAHPSRADWPALARKWRRTTEEAWGLRAGEHGGLRGGGPRARALWALRALAMIPSVAAHAPRVLRHEALGPGERARALATLARLRLARCGWMLRQAARPARAENRVATQPEIVNHRL